MAVHNDPAEYGGYEYEASGKVPEKLICNICTKLIRDPYLTVCCGQHFCGSCLKHWTEKQGKSTCPHCREENFTHVLNKALKREIDELQIYCTHHGEGCQWVGELGNLQTHLDKACSYVKVACPNGCLKMCLRMKLSDHLTNNCILRISRCGYCGEYDRQASLTAHYYVCPEYPLDCPKECGVKGIKRKDICIHNENCPLEPVQCPFEEVGCEARLIRRDFQAHMQTTTHHLLLIYRAMRAEMDILKRGVKANVEVLMGTCTEEQKLQLQSITALLSHQLRKNGDCIEFEMHDFQKYKEKKEAWFSPPFYYKEGYKMCLAVYPKMTHVSVSLFLLKGEFDNELTWPISNSSNITIGLLGRSKSVQICRQCTPSDKLQRISKDENSSTRHVLWTKEQFCEENPHCTFLAVTAATISIYIMPHMH